MSAMPQKQEPSKMSEAEYLAFERQSDIKHEYIDGYAYAMAGARRKHSLITGNLFASSHSQFQGKNCEVHQSELRVKVSASKYFYPDITIICGKVILADNEFDNLLNPTVIIEVLSPSTEAFDRGNKFQFYRSIDSLKEYILVSQDIARIEGFSRQESGLWTFDASIGLDTSFKLSTIDCTFDLATIYQGISFDKDDGSDDKSD